MSSFHQSDVKNIYTSNGEHGDDFALETVMFEWAVDGFGFGTTTFYYENGKLCCDNETMSKEQIKTLLCAFVDAAEFQS